MLVTSSLNMYKWFLAWRYLHTKLIAFFGIASVMLCVAMVLVVMSVMGGFLDTIRARSKGLQSEIVIESNSLQGFPFYEEFSAFVKRELPDVVRVTTPSIYSYGIFRVPATNLTKPVRVMGIRLEDYVQINDFKKGLHYERYFPGTTTMKPQKQPLAGYSGSDMLSLPPEFAEANRRWRETETDLEKIANFDRQPFVIAEYPEVRPLALGERVFAVGSEAPAYVGAERDGVIVGVDLLHYRRADGDFDRNLARGAELALTLMPLTGSGTTTGEPPILWPVRYADDSRTGIFEIDSLCVYVDLDVLQHKLAMDPQVTADGGKTLARTSQLLIGLQPGVDLDAAKAQIQEMWWQFLGQIPSMVSQAEARALELVKVYTWEDLQRDFIAAVEKEKVLVTILFSLISVVAIALVGCIFYMIVEKKTRDIGILKAIGASGRGVAGMFVVYAGAVGVCGAVLGLFLGSVFVWNINDIQDWLAQLNPQLRVWSPEVYSFDRIPEEVKRADAIWVALVAVLASIVGSLIPAYLAGRIWPVQALRYE